jgi:hypothetical protein
VPDGLVVRAAREANREQLVSFDCPSLDLDVEPFVRQRSLDLHRSTGLGDDHRLLLGFDGPDGPLVAVAHHRRNYRFGTTDGLVLPGTELSVVATTGARRDANLTDRTP